MIAIVDKASDYIDAFVNMVNFMFSAVFANNTTDSGNYFYHFLPHYTLF